ncbi:MAG TPA: LysM peptidoglycan-binding domain-containing protein [Clostridia bacterium]|nr:LysM peptidoglycan-binding domain-containing protein [Clostridia bacterium]
MANNTPSCPGGTLYNIRPGDTFFNIAARFGVTVHDLMRANPRVDPNNLRICDLICVPAQPRPGVCPTGSTAYLVAPGDTLFSIAARFNTTVEAINSANPCIDPTNLRVSQLLCIPQAPMPTVCPPGSTQYTIRPGDTLFSLAIQFNTTVQAILAINPGLDPNNLRVGQIICIPGPTPTQCPPGSTQYTIRPGDTLFSLAIQFNTTVQAILAINPGLDPNNLRVGQIICIPGPSPTQPGRCPTGSFEYTIRSGDTIYNLAIEFNTTVEAILAINPGINPNNLQIGQVICIPGTGPGPGRCPAGTFEYTIMAGDTFFSLANRFNTTVAAIQAANPNVDPNNLQIGQVICIPGAGPGRCPAGTFEYTIMAGDTFFSLANRFNTTVAAIQAANPNVDPNNLQIGQVICIPGAGPGPGRCPAGTFEYTVRSGDTFFALARRFNTTVAAIQAANPNVDPDRLQIGQQICIPQS